MHLVSGALRCEHMGDPIWEGYRGFAVCKAMILEVGLVETRASQFLFAHTRHLLL